MSVFDERVDAAVAEYDRHFSSRTQTVFGAGMRRTAMAEAIRAADAVEVEATKSSATFISPYLPSMIRGLYEADVGENSIQTVLDLAADLVQELIGRREADAVVTEGQVEEVLRQAFQDWDEHDDLFTVQARAVMSLIRGGAK